MILLCGIPSEPPLQMVIEAATALRVEHIVFNQREAHHSDLYFEVDGNGEVDGVIRLREKEWALNRFTGVFVRMMDYQHLPENQWRATPSASTTRHRSIFMHDALVEWLEFAECRVMNRTSAMGSNGSKPYQAQLIMQAGFAIPSTLITNEPDEVKRFLDKHKRIVFKSISSVRSIVQELNAAKMKELERIRYLPTQFQEYVAGTNVRVHVAGAEVYATEIRSDAVDYRYAYLESLDVEMVPIELPEQIRVQCIDLASLLQLPLCGIDLKRTSSRTYYCFEVNPSPGYSYYQEQTGQPIAEAIVRYLEQPVPDAWQ